MPLPLVITAVADSTPLLAVSWAVVVVCVGIFVWRARFLGRVLLMARGSSPAGSAKPFDRLGARLKSVIIFSLGQRRMPDEGFIAVAHYVAHYAFFLFVFGAALELVERLIPGASLSVVKENAYLLTGVDLAAGLVVLGLLFMAYRRLVLKPLNMEQSPDAFVILIWVAVLMMTYLIGEGAKYAELGIQGGWEAPIGQAVGRLMLASNLGPGAAGPLADTCTYVHLALMFAFLAYLPFSKHLHLMSAPFNIFFGSHTPPGELRGGDESAYTGAATITELSWRHLLNGLTCVECGRCDRVCPAVLSGETLSPKELTVGLKEQITDLGPRLLAAKKEGRGNDHLHPYLRGVVSEEVVWGCRMCYACVQRCPVRNEHVPLLVQLRRRLVSEGSVDERLGEALMNLERYGNSFGQSDRNRTRWTRSLDFQVKDATSEPVEYLWFVGDYASYDPGLQEVTRCVARLFHQAKLDFGILGRAERNSGNDVRRVGEEGLFEALVEHNIEALGRASFQRLVTTDPHSFNTLKNEYGAFGGHYEVLHYTQVLAQLIGEGRLPVQRNLPYRVTYHDPCYLGRYNGVYEEPRWVLRSLGLTLVEMPRSGEASLCCGAGGGFIWREDTHAEERPSEIRVREAAALDVGYLVTTCPKDVSMFRDAVKTTGTEDKLQVKDLAELVEEACCPAGPERTPRAASSD